VVDRIHSIDTQSEPDEYQDGPDPSLAISSLLPSSLDIALVHGPIGDAPHSKTSRLVVVHKGLDCPRRRRRSEPFSDFFPETFALDGETMDGKGRERRGVVDEEGEDASVLGVGGRRRERERSGLECRVEVR
jgi:hypothetical protein